MAIGVGLGSVAPSVTQPIHDLHLVEIGLILTMHPPFAKLNYGQLTRVFSQWRVLGLSLLQNRLVGPTLIITLALAFFGRVVPGLSARPEFFPGLVFIGMARCIAMVLVRNDLAEGSSEYAAGLVAFNSVFGIVTYGVYVTFFALFLPEALGLTALSGGSAAFNITAMQVFEAIAIFLGIPFAAGILSRFAGTRPEGAEWYDETLVRTIDPMTLIALLFIVIVMFAMQGERIVGQPTDVLLVAVPLTTYFVVMFFVSFGMGHRIGADYSTTTAIGFTAASSNSELAIAVAVAVFTVESGVVFTTVIGPLIEVPVLFALGYAALWLQRNVNWRGHTTGQLDSTTPESDVDPVPEDD